MLMCPLNNKYYANLFITFVDFRQKHYFSPTFWSYSQFGPYS